MSGAKIKRNRDVSLVKIPRLLFELMNELLSKYRFWSRFCFAFIHHNTNLKIFKNLTYHQIALTMYFSSIKQEIKNHLQYWSRPFVIWLWDTEMPETKIYRLPRLFHWNISVETPLTSPLDLQSRSAEGPSVQSSRSLRNPFSFQYPV